MSGVRAFCVLLASGLAAQVEPDRVADPDHAARKQATRLIRLMELPDRRVTAAADLLKLGAKAVPSLILALDDPRPDVVARLALVLRVLGDASRPAIPKLETIAAGKDTKLAFAATWALSAFAPRGVTLIAESAGKVQELDREQKVVFTLPGITNAFHAELLPTGNYLVAVMNKGEVTEVDRQGNEVWKIDKLRNPCSATRLPGGHTLICLVGDKEVVEVDAAGKTVWRRVCKTPYSAVRLANGNTLIADYGAHEVVEVTPSDKTVWSYTGLKGPLDAVRLGNGRTLITSHAQKAVHEVAPDGKVWLTVALPSSGWSACRTAGGDTIAGGGNYLIGYDAKGKELWRAKGRRTVTSVRHY